MNSITRALMDQGLAVNQRVTSALGNGLDRLFRPDSMVRSDQTPYKVLLQHPPMSLRAYAPLEEEEIPLGRNGSIPVAKDQHEVPIIIVPPLAATPLIFDLMPERSLVRFLLAQGYRVYMVNWGNPGKEYSHLGVRDYVEDMLTEAVETVREHAGVKPVTLLGWCMGGLFSLIYAGLCHDPDVKNIVTIASPIDSRQGGVAGKVVAALEKPAYLIRKYTSFRLHNLDPKLLQVPGWMNVLAFKATNPVGSLMTYWDLITRLWDREFVESHTTTSNFLDNMFDYPGGIVQDFFVKVGVDNDLSRGRMEIGGKVSAFDRINASILAFAGETDAIVTPEAAHKVIDLVASEDKEFVIAPGGHAGVVMGGKAQDAVWAVAADWLSRRSAL